MRVSTDAGLGVPTARWGHRSGMPFGMPDLMING